MVVITDQIKYSLKGELPGFADFRYKSKLKKKKRSHDDTKLFGLSNWKYEVVNKPIMSSVLDFST